MSKDAWLIAGAIILGCWGLIIPLIAVGERLKELRERLDRYARTKAESDRADAFLRDLDGISQP